MSQIEVDLSSLSERVKEIRSNSGLLPQLAELLEELTRGLADNLARFREVQKNPGLIVPSEKILISKKAANNIFNLYQLMWMQNPDLFASGGPLENLGTFIEANFEIPPEAAPAPTPVEVEPDLNTKIFKGFAKELRTRHDMPEAFILNGVELDPFKPLTADELEKVGKDLIEGLIRLAYFQMDLASTPKPAQINGSKFVLNVPSGAYNFDSSPIIELPGIVEKVKLTFSEFQKSLPAGLDNFALEGMFRILGLLNLHNGAEVVTNLSGAKVPITKIMETVGSSNQKNLANPELYSNLFASVPTGFESQISRSDWENFRVRNANWLPGKVMRMTISMVDMSRRGVTEPGLLPVPFLYPILTKETPEMFATVHANITTLYKREILAKEGRIDLTKTEEFYIKLGVQKGFELARSHYIEAMADPFAQEQEIAQAANARAYHKTKNVGAADTTKGYGEETGKISVRYAEHLDRYLNIFALFPSNALHVQSNEADFYNYYTSLRARFGTEPLSAEAETNFLASEDAQDFLGVFTHDQLRTPGGEMNWSAMKNKYVLIQVTPEIATFGVPGEKVLIPKRNLTTMPDGSIRVRGTIHDLAFRMRTEEVDPRTGQPILLFNTVPTSPFESYKNWLSKTLEWYKLNTVIEGYGSGSKPAIGKFKAPSEIDMTLIQEPLAYGTKLKLSLTVWRRIIYQGIDTVKSLFGSKTSLDKLSSDNPQASGREALRLSGLLSQLLRIPHGELSPTDVVSSGFSEVYENIVKYWLDAVVVGGKPKNYPVVAADGSISFDTNKEIDLSSLRRMFRDISDNGLAISFPRKLDYWITKYEQDVTTESKLGLWIELLHILRLIDFQKDKLDPIGVEDDHPVSAAKFRDIHVVTMSGRPPITIDREIVIKEVFWEYVLDLVSSTLKTAGEPSSREDCVTFLEGMSPHLSPRWEGDPDANLYTEEGFSKTLSAHLQRVGISGNFPRLILNLQYYAKLRAGKLKNVLTFDAYHKKSRGEVDKEVK